MTVLNTLGWLLLSLPFVTLFAWMVKDSGWKAATKSETIATKDKIMPNIIPKKPKAALYLISL